MIISDLSAPYKSLYVIGANIIFVLRSYELGFIDPLELYEKFKDTNEGISLAYFYFGLDWLYMIDAIELTESGDVKLCS